MQIKHPKDPASPAQVSFLKSLLSKKQVEEQWLKVAEARLEAGITKDVASQMIEWFKAQPDLPKAALTVLPNGVYETHGAEVFVVKTSKTSGKPYAMKWVGTRYVYEVGHYRYLLANNPAPLSLAQAAVLGIDSGYCVICGRELSDEKSLAAGIGPVCAKSQTKLIQAQYAGVTP
jgi:Family of unknown function (DUF6011)